MQARTTGQVHALLRTTCRNWNWVRSDTACLSAIQRVRNQIQVHTVTSATLPAAVAIITPWLSLRRLDDPRKGIPKPLMAMVAYPPSLIIARYEQLHGLDPPYHSLL